MTLNKILVFVYGSLKSGFANHVLIEECECLGIHSTEAKFTMVSLGPYPAVLEHGNTAIQGEIYAVDQAVFETLDTLEDYPDLYNRILIATSHGPAWMYVMEAGSHYAIVESGIWQ